MLFGPPNRDKLAVATITTNESRIDVPGADPLVDWAEEQPAASQIRPPEGRRWSRYRPAIWVLIYRKGYTMKDAVEAVSARANFNEKDCELLYFATRNWKTNGTLSTKQEATA